MPNANCRYCSSVIRNPKNGDFCNRSCYESWVKENKGCPDCSKSRCLVHGKEYQARRRAGWSAKEKKAKSLQASYRQASDRTATLTLADARKLIEDPPFCQYCGERIKWSELSIDHKMPRARGGSSDPSNLVWTDLRCNVMKGSLTDEEFRQLLAYLSDKPEVAKILSQRLRAAGFMYGRAA